MDLVAGVRKEGSRGGRSEFKWSEVQSSQHRENYLGHSVMAPVGRWQKGRDLQWYVKDDASSSKHDLETARRQRQEEIQQIKKAEEEALSKALGYTINLGQTYGTSNAATGSNSVTIGNNQKTRYDVGEQPASDKEKRSRRERSPRSDCRDRRTRREREYRDRQQGPREDRERHNQCERDHKRRSRSPRQSHRHRNSRYRSGSPLGWRSVR